MLEVVILLMNYLIKYGFQLKDLNIHVFDIVTGKNGLKISTKDLLCEYKCKFNER